MILDRDSFLGVHLPGQVRRRRSRGRGSGPPARRGGCQIGLEQPTLECSRRGDRADRRLLEQVDSNQSGTPGGMFASQLDRGPGGARIQSRGDVGRGIVGSDAVDPSASKSPDQTPHGHDRQPERLGDLIGCEPLLPESKHGLTDRNRNGTWHGVTSRENRHEASIPYCTNVTSRSNRVSLLRDQSSCRVTRSPPPATHRAKRKIRESRPMLTDGGAGCFQGPWSGDATPHPTLPHEGLTIRHFSFAPADRLREPIFLPSPSGHWYLHSAKPLEEQRFGEGISWVPSVQ